MSKRIIRIYDCSNSPERPKHDSENMGPAENDIMRDLKKYSKTYNFEFVDNVDDAVVVITNDVFPSDIKNRNIFKVKRMDGIYWQDTLTYKNKVLNDAAFNSDLVIFISEFSQNSLNRLYQFAYIKNSVVVLNNADTAIFKKIDVPDSIYNPYNKFTWAASASNWKREEKRFQDLLEFAKNIAFNDRIFLIGKCEYGVPENIIKVNYIDSDEEKAKILNQADGFINLSYRDAGSKVTCQALACGLPVLYAESGGVPELVKAYGVGVPIYDTNKHIGKTPILSIEDMKYSYLKFRNEYHDLRNKMKYKNTMHYQSTIKEYFETIREYFGNSKNE